ncbi:MAG: hypothetical protein K1000chlam3_01215 [Chlamydiae bacterium]|nr:hypothetical protein [Chlamydiota bacterium]
MLSVQNQRGVDQELAEIATGVGNIVSWPMQKVAEVIDKLQQLPIEEKNRFDTGLPTLADIAGAFTTYHKQIFISSSQWSDEVKNATERFTRYILYPLSIFHIGESFRTTISEKIVGNIAKAVAFAAFQIFHLIPWLLIVAAFEGIHFLYIVAPIEILTAFAGTALFMFYRLVKEIEKAAKILEEDFNLATNLEVWWKNKKRNIKNIALAPLRWCASWVPRRVITYCGSKDKKA